MPPTNVSEIIDYGIKDWGYATFEPQKTPQIRYNPTKFVGVPDYVLAFVRVHEFAHVVLRTSNEFICDSWAAHELNRTDPEILEKASVYFRRSLKHQTADRWHGSGIQLANLIAQIRKPASEQLNRSGAISVTTNSVRIHVHQPTDPEFRGIWVNAWNPGFQTPAEVSKLIADVRSANLNAIFVQVRKRGDAFYNSRLEPRSELIAKDFDPLADVIAKAHDTNTGPRIEVHAWIVTYPIQRIQTDPLEHDQHRDPRHLFNAHKDWLSQNKGGVQLMKEDYWLDPAHPDVQQHLVNVAMDVVTNYDIDGLHLDHMQYPNRIWGYNPVSVERFKSAYHRNDVPFALDKDWTNFRRDQVTSLVRRIYTATIAAKPHVKVSVAALANPPAPVTMEDWQNSIEYEEALQDWVGWLKEGIIDFAVPMMFYRQDQEWADRNFRGWLKFASEHQFKRQVMIGQGEWLNSISNTLCQIRNVQNLQTNQLAGSVLYAYGVPGLQETNRVEFLRSLIEEGSGLAPSVFGVVVKPSAMTWKTQSTTGNTNAGL